jgi:hypothetical protein
MVLLVLQVYPEFKDLQ